MERYLQGHPPDFIKVDIEGCEVFLLVSMQYILEQGIRPPLLIEFHPQKCMQRGVTDSGIAREVCSYGYLMRNVLASSEGYRIVPVSFDSIGHDNLLFLTPESLSISKILALKWN